VQWQRKLHLSRIFGPKAFGPQRCTTPRFTASVQTEHSNRPPRSVRPQLGRAADPFDDWRFAAAPRLRCALFGRLVPPPFAPARQPSAAPGKRRAVLYHGCDTQVILKSVGLLCINVPFFRIHECVTKIGTCRHVFNFFLPGMARRA
jgi:hypothetical protein